MHWYVSNEGNVAGPLTAEEVHEGIADGTIEAGMHVRDEHGQWGPIELSPFAGLLPQIEAPASWRPKTQGVTPPKSDSLVGWWIVIGLASVVGGWLVFRTWRSNQPQEAWAVPTTKFVYEAPPAHAPAPAPAPDRLIATRDNSWCRIMLTSNEEAPVPVFPSKEGWEEFQLAAEVSNEAMHSVASRRSAFWVDAKTPCKLLNSDQDFSRVQITGGTHVGRVGFVNFSMVVER